MLHSRFIVRQIQHASSQSLVFMVCVALAVMTVAGVRSIARSVKAVMEADAKGLQGGDIVLKSPFPIATDLDMALAALESQGHIRTSRGWRFYTVARAPDTSQTALVQLQITDASYPLYGSVTLSSERPFRETLMPGTVVAEPNVLTQLGIDVGDSMRLGRASLTVVDTIRHESAHPLSFFGLGARVLVNQHDLAALDLIKPGSRVRYLRYVRLVDPRTDLTEMAQHIRQAAPADGSSVDTYRDSGSRMGRFFDRFFYFLNLVAAFNLCVAGIGIYSAARAYLRQGTHSLAIIKSLGASPAFVYGHFLLLLLVLGVAGGGLGITIGYFLQKSVLAKLSILLQQPVQPFFYWDLALQILLLAGGVVVVFSAVPLLKLGGITPLQILTQKAVAMGRRMNVRVALVLVMGALGGLLAWQLGISPRTFYFLTGLLGYLAVLYLLCRFLLWVLRSISVKGLLLRHARSGLFRPGNATLPTLLSITAAAVLLLTLYLVERNLNDQLLNTYPADSPNLFFIDIQPDQRGPFQNLMDRRTRLYPVVRSRLTAINGNPVDRHRERRRKGDNLARPFNLTYRQELLADERIVAGDTLLQAPPGQFAVSVLDTIADIGNIKIGDRLSFNVQGLPLDAVVCSIRTRTRTSFRPFFYFVFAPAVLQEAPHTFFAAMRVPPEEITALRHTVVSRFPNITVIDATKALLTFGKVGLKLAVIVRLLGLASCLVGLLIMVSALVATRQERLRQSVYYRIVGAPKFFVQNVFLMESMLIGTVAATSAILLSQTSTWMICRQALDISYRAYWGHSLAMGALILVTIVSVGWIASRAVLHYNPLTYLREHAES